MECGRKDVMERVAVEAAGGVHRQGRGFIQHDQRGVLMQDADVAVGIVDTHPMDSPG